MIKIILYAILEGITEWLPISSTGHLILFEKIVNLSLNEAFLSSFRVFIQLGAIMAVIGQNFTKIWPIKNKKIEKSIIIMWFKIFIVSIPALIVGLFLDFEKYFYNYKCFAIALILVGIIFIIIENKKIKENKFLISDISYKDALLIGAFQAVAAIFPGVSRSGATIIGGLILGLSRSLATNFSFFLAIPAMMGASFLKILKLGFNYNKAEITIILIGTLVSLLVSLLVIKFLTKYLEKHNFKVFAWYRILIGILILIIF